MGVEIIVGIIVLIFGGGAFTARRAAAKAVARNEQSKRELAEVQERNRLELLAAQVQKCDTATHEIQAEEIEQYGEALTTCSCDWCLTKPEREAAAAAKAKRDAERREALRYATRKTSAAQDYLDDAEQSQRDAVARVKALTEEAEELTRTSLVATLREEAGLALLPGQAKATARLFTVRNDLVQARIALDAANNEWATAKDGLKVAKRALERVPSVKTDDDEEYDWLYSAYNDSDVALPW